MTNKHQILIVDDHAIVRHGLAQLIEREPDMQVAFQAEQATEALDILRQHHLDMVILDISLPGMSGIDLTKQIAARHPGLPVLAVSMHDESEYYERAFQAGAKGYIMKQEATEKVLFAARKILRGEVYLSDRMQSIMLQRFVDGRGETPTSFTDNLTDREFEVLRLVGMGRGTSEIAREMGRSVKTVESHRAHLKEKLNLKTATELTYFAINWVARQKNG